MPLTRRELVQTASFGAALVVRTRVIELSSMLSDRVVSSGGTPALPLCVVACAVRREFIALSHIDTWLLVLTASIGALVLLASHGPKFSRTTLKIQIKQDGEKT
jgi:hypothetical protein